MKLLKLITLHVLLKSEDTRMLMNNKLLKKEKNIEQ